MNTNALTHGSVEVWDMVASCRPEQEETERAKGRYMIRCEVTNERMRMHSLAEVRSLLKSSGFRYNKSVWTWSVAA